MSEQGALLQAIRDDPDDDEVRLVYADWLDDRGGAEPAARAEFIRTQIALTRLAENDAAFPELVVRERALLGEYGDHWRESVRDRVEASAFRRGFIDWLRITARQFLLHGDGLFQQEPITGLEIHDAANAADSLAASPLLGRLHSLGLRDGDRLGAAHLERFLTSSHLGGLRTLDLSFQRIERAGVGLLTAADLSALSSLLVAHNDLGDASVQLLARSRRLAGLTRLDLGANNLGRAAAEALAASPVLRLIHLDLGYNDIGNTGLESLAQSSLLPHLRVLHLARNGIDSAGVEALTRSPGASGLVALDLGCNSIGRAGARLLADSPALANLSALDLRFDFREIGDSGVAYLADSPYLRRLTRLDLSSNDIHASGAIALAGSPGMRHLTVLDLYSNKIGTSGVSALARSPHLRRLTQLNLNGNGIDPEGIETLAQSPNLDQVVELDLRGNYIGRSGTEALVRSPHLCGITKLWLDVASEGSEKLLHRFGGRVRFG